jgi:AcrR family transcriptional regulator
MARPLSEDKRTAILAAAAQLVAEQGVGAPTSRIAKLAGVAEGTLFTYFAGKDDLLNQLYLDLKAELRETMIGGFPQDGDVAVRARHVWDRYIDWGAARPLRRKAMLQLGVSDRITPATLQAGAAGFREIEALMQAHTEAGDAPSAAFIVAILESLAETTLAFIAKEPARAEHYKQAGFNAFWRATGMA